MVDKSPMREAWGSSRERHPEGESVPGAIEGPRDFEVGSRTGQAASEPPRLQFCLVEEAEVRR